MKKNNFLNTVLSAAVKAAEKAGEIMLSSTPDNVRIKGRSDYVTDIDIKCQEAVKEVISSSFPEHEFLAEEDGGGFRPADNLWIIDPLDGTTNFIHGLGHSAVSVAYCSGSTVEAGAVYDPYRKEMFTAVKGNGAYLNGKPIYVSGTNEMELSLIATGMPFRRPEKSQAYFKALSDVLQGSSGIRRMGSAALDLAYTACGRFDGFFEGWLSVWDIAAGILICEEAGASVSDFNGERKFFDHGCVIVSSPGIFDKLYDKIKGHLNNEQLI